MRIALDCMGSDGGPKVLIEGALQALKEWPDMAITLYGPQEELKAALAELGGEENERLGLVHAPDVISNHDHAALSVRRRTESSLVMAANAVKNGEAQGFLSAGNTGAVMVAALFCVGRIKGIERPALATTMPGREKPYVLLDVGANADCKPEQLLQFAHMGRIYSEAVLGVQSPELGLLNIGAEAEKGSECSIAAHRLLAEAGEKGTIRFKGNVEGRDIAKPVVDVLVCDGFTGNVVLKLMEGFSMTLLGMIKQALLSSFRAKMGALLIKPALGGLKKKLDYSEYGGAPLLGVKGAVVKAHGSSTPKAIYSALRQTRAMLSGDIVARITAALDADGQDGV